MASYEDNNNDNSNDGKGADPVGFRNAFARSHQYDNNNNDSNNNNNNNNNYDDYEKQDNIEMGRRRDNDDDDDYYNVVDENDDAYFDSNNNNNNSNNKYDNDYDDELGGVEDQRGNNSTLREPMIMNDPQLRQKERMEQHPPKGNCCTRCCNKIVKYCKKCYAPKAEYRGICSCPHTRCYGVMGVLTAQGGLMMNLYVIGTCKFSRIKIINPVTGEAIPGSERGYGFDARETNYGQTPDYRECTYYPEEEKAEIWDSWFGAAKFFSYVSAILGVLGFLILFSICCMAYSKSMFERWLFWGYIVASITVAFSFLMFGSDFCQRNQCGVADGCGWAISCFFFHLLAANTVKSFPEPRATPPKKDKNDTDPNNNNKGGPPTIDDVYDELWYDDEDDKYPPPLPDGQQRGIIYNDKGQPEFDDGDEYFDELGNFIIPEEQQNRPKRRRPRRDGDDDDDDDDEYEDDDDSDYTYDDEDDLDESEYDPLEEDVFTWKERQDAKKAAREERDARKKKEAEDDDEENVAAASNIDFLDNHHMQETTPEDDGTYDTTGKQPVKQPSDDDDDADDDDDDDNNNNNIKSSGYIAPEEREFDPYNTDPNKEGNLGVGYEHIDIDEEIEAEEEFQQDKNKAGKAKKILYGAPSRPANITNPPIDDHGYDGRRDNDDDDDDDNDDRPVLT